MCSIPFEVFIVFQAERSLPDVEVTKRKGPPWLRPVWVKLSSLGGPFMAFPRAQYF